jgi:hypothetical protein
MAGPIVAGLALATAGVPAHAEACRERFVRYLVGTPDGPPGQARIVIQMGPTSFENEFLFLSQDHNLYRPIRPAGQPWILVHDGARHQSTDQGRTWSRLQSFDRLEARAQAVAAVRAQAETAKDVRCGEEQLDGVMHDTFEATLAVPGGDGAESRNRYWVARGTAAATRTISTSSMDGMTMVTTQDWKPSSQLTLPKP